MLHQRPIASITIAPNGQWSVSGSDGGKLVLWLPNTDKMAISTLTLSTTIKKVLVVDQSTVAVLGEDGIIRLLQVNCDTLNPSLSIIWATQPIFTNQKANFMTAHDMLPETQDTFSNRAGIHIITKQAEHPLVQFELPLYINFINYAINFDLNTEIFRVKTLPWSAFFVSSAVNGLFFKFENTSEAHIIAGLGSVAASTAIINALWPEFSIPWSAWLVSGAIVRRTVPPTHYPAFLDIPRFVSASAGAYIIHMLWPEFSILSLMYHSVSSITLLPWGEFVLSRDLVKTVYPESVDSLSGILIFLSLTAAGTVALNLTLDLTLLQVIYNLAIAAIITRVSVGITGIPIVEAAEITAMLGYRDFYVSDNLEIYSSRSKHQIHLNSSEAITALASTPTAISTRFANTHAVPSQGIIPAGEIQWVLNSNHYIDAQTGAPIFTVQAWQAQQVLGYVKLYGAPEFCRSRNGLRHNIIELGGVLKGQEHKIRTDQNMPICRALPPRIPAYSERIGRAVTHGALAGTTNVLGRMLEKDGFSQTVASIISQTAYYTSLYAINYLHRYNELCEIETEEDDSVAWRAASQAAADTAIVAATQTFFKGVNYVGNRLQQAGWRRTGQACQTASKYFGMAYYTQYFFKNCSDNSVASYAGSAVKTAGLIGASVGSQKVIETAGDYALNA